jgi:hypothetical protein
MMISTQARPLIRLFFTLLFTVPTRPQLLILLVYTLMATSKWWNETRWPRARSTFNPHLFLPCQLYRPAQSFASHFASFALLPSNFSAVQICLFIESERAELYCVCLFNHGQGVVEFLLAILFVHDLVELCAKFVITNTKWREYFLQPILPFANTD